MFGTIVSGVAAAFKAVAAALGLIQQNKDQQAGAIAQQAADNAGVITDVQKAKQATDAVAAGGDAAIDSLLLNDARPEGK